MESADLVSKVKELLASKKQIHTRLTDGKDCFCIMGIVAVALGSRVEGYGIVDITGVSHSHTFYTDTFPFNLGVRKSLILEHKDALSLTNRQVREVSTHEGWDWVSLNDDVNFSFQQFSTLIDLVMENRDVVEI